MMCNLDAIKCRFIWGSRDVLGVLMEFSSRAERKSNPVVGMREYGNLSQLKGTWSDDSSKALASFDSIIQRGGINYDDM